MSLLAFLLARRSCRPAVRASGRLGFALLFSVAVLLLPSPARAADQMQASAQALLSQADAPLQVRLQGSFDSAWPTARVRVQVTGPQAPRSPLDQRPVTGSFEEEVGELSGSWERSFTVPPNLMSGPGAYLVTATLSAGDQSLSASTWLGRISPNPQTVDLAAVWPVAAGVRRDAEGVFLDQSLERAVTPDAAGEGSLFAFFSLADRHPEWHFTLAVEPLLLTQIDDMADGYRRHGEQGPEEVGQGEQSAVLAEQALATFRSVAALESVQVIPMPFASPHLPLLASQGSEDGLDQMQLGKSQLTEHLQLTGTPDAAYPPGLELTTESLGYLSRASIDYALAGSETSEGLAEVPEDGEGPVRVRDAENNRLTLLFVNPELRASLTPAWDAGLFFAALASELAAGKRGPFVVAPAQDYQTAPGPFLQLVGDVLRQHSWIRTRTLSEVMRSHPPSSRPIFLSRYASEVEGFVGEALAQRLLESRALAADFLAAADPDRAPVDRLKLLLYQAQSRYWFAGPTDPRIANLGLSYLDAADELVRGEFDKVDVLADKSVIIMGDEGEIPLAVINATGYPLDVTIGIEGTGLRLDGDAERSVTLGPQENIIRLPVKLAGGSGSVRVSVRSGSSLLDEEVVTVRAVSVATLVPWALGLMLVVLVLVALLFRRRVRGAQA